MIQQFEDNVQYIEDGSQNLLTHYTLKNRQAVLIQFEMDIDHLLNQLKNYAFETKYTLENKLSSSIVSRMTMNVLMVMIRTFESLSDYYAVIFNYLLDERYETNHDYWLRFAEISREIKSLISNLQITNVFDSEDFDEKDFFEEYSIASSLYSGSRSLVKLENKLAYLNGSELLACLDKLLERFALELLDLKSNALYAEDSMLEKVFDSNYELYKIVYWPEKVKNFRAHIANKHLKGNITTDALEGLRRETIRDFESNHTGSIWRDYSENKAKMAIEMKRQKLNEEQWLYFYTEISKIEEYDRWIEELKNPPETDEDKEKRVSLWRSNLIFNENKMQANGIDILKLYRYIEKYFISKDMKVYQWYALRRFLEKIDVLNECTNVVFQEQMNKTEWFGSVPKPCSDNEMNNFNFLNGKHPSTWVVSEIPSGSRASKTGLRNNFNAFSNLELYENELKR